MFAKKSIAALVFLLVLFIKTSVLASAPGQIETFSKQLNSHSPKKYVYRFEEGAKPMSFLRAMNLLENSISFRLQVREALRKSGLKNIYWECPPVSRSTATQDFEFVVIEAIGLQNSPADPKPFEDKLISCQDRVRVISFESKDKDAPATLIVPCNHASLDSYAHLGIFLEKAPLEQQHELLKNVGHILLEKLSKTQNPIWLNTSGRGVKFLHVRLDTKPKYYIHMPYTKWPYQKQNLRESM